MKKIHNFLFGTLRGRLILSVAAVHAVLMMLFIIDLTHRQRDMLMERQEDDAIALSHALSTTASGWLASKDISGLQELVEAQRRYPELVFAILTDADGHILAHTDGSKVGKFLLDLPRDARQTVINKTPEIVDVAVPALLADKHVGWVRIGLGQKVALKKLNAITLNGTFYALLAILIGSFIAWLMGGQITRRLYAIQHTISEVSAGNPAARSRITGTDEAAQLAREFNAMLDALSEREEKISKSEARFAKLFNLAAVPLCLINKNGVLVDFNKRFEQIFGYNHQDIPTIKEWWQLAYPDPDYRKLMVSGWEAEVKTASEQKRDIAPSECKVTCKNGKVRTLVASGAAINDDLLITFYDITNRKQAEASISKLVLRYKTLLHAASEGIHILDDQGHVLEANEAFCSMLGYTGEELLQLNVTDWDAQWSKEKLLTNLGEIISHPDPIVFETRHRRKDGTFYDVEISSIGVMLEGHNYIYAAARDITERKRKFDELVKLNRVHSLISQINDLILWSHDREKLFHEICTIATTYGKFRMSWIGLVNDDTHAVIPVAWDGFENGYLTKIKEISIDKVFEGKGPTGRAVREGKTVVCNDIANDPMMEPWSNEAIQRGYYSSISLPIKVRNNVIGAFNLYSDETDFFSLEEVTLLEKITHNIAFSLETILIEEERKQTEEKIRQLSQAVEQSPVTIVITDTMGAIQYVNPKFIETTGYSYEEAIGKNPRILNSGQTTLEEYKELWETISEGNEWYGEFHNKRKDGTLYWESSAISPIINAKGETTHYIAIKEDITERKQMEEALRMSEKRLRTIIETEPECVKIIDQKGDLLDINTSGLAMLESNSLAEVKSHTLLEFILPEYRTAFQELHKRVMQGENGLLEFEVIGLRGTKRWLETHAAPMRDEKGEVTMLLGITRDITNRKLSEQELIKAKEHAEESDRLKSAFLANMSHEIRTPMNGILGFAELLKEPGLSGKDQQEYIKIIGESGARMLNIINDIVDISKIESKQMKVSLSETSINEKTEYIFNFFKPEATNKGIQLVFKNGLPANESLINTDSEKVYAILTNLVKNAIKFTDHGLIEFGYSLKTDNEPAELEFFVKDTGIGIPKDKQEAIFDRFVQADISDKRAFQGAGLGLSISKAYVEMLGGKIWVESEEGKGSSFYFTIPYNAVPKIDIVLNTIASEYEAENQIKSLKILIVEDDKISKLLLSKAIKAFSKEVLKAATGVEAVEICRNNPDIDLVMMDVNMPIMNGYEATRQIRQFNNDVIIIAQTAYGMSSDREEAIAAGCNDYISKPINITLLNGLIQKYF